ncbi:MAG TPA: YitT family protein [Syntrophomonadaceae bacterium]|nr:YitT family protein [Syntrophomonadaceae bacterium]HPR93885.1 YitT family protein [Syntrophomonadaceae bacterium]
MEINIKPPITRKSAEAIKVFDLLGIAAGSLILALSIQGIMIPGNLLTGGLTGLAIVLEYIFKIDVWVWYAVLNLPLLIVGYKYVSRRFILYSIFGAAVLTLFLAILKNIDFGIEDLFLAAVLGGVLSGTGSGLIFRSKGSTGGLDIVAVIIRLSWGFNIGQTFLAFNILVLLSSLLVFNFEKTLYAAVAIYIASKVMDTVVTGLETTRTAMIISAQNKDIAQIIINNLHRGCTFLDAKGAYTGEEKEIVLVTVAKTQLPTLKEIVFESDPKAFIIINETIEAFGKGFRPGGAEF